MATNRIMRGRVVRRALLLAAAAGLLALSACGGSGSSSQGDQERDVKLLNDLLGRQLAVVRTYGGVIPDLRGADLAMAQQFRGQEQEHVDATTKTLRGLGGEAEASSETIEASDLKTRAENLELLYAMESATLGLEQSVVGRLTSDPPRPPIDSMAANQAQRLVLLRQALGARRLEAIPSAFETGEIPAPERTIGR